MSRETVAGFAALIGLCALATLLGWWDSTVERAPPPTTDWQRKYEELEDRLLHTPNCVRFWT